MIELCVTQKKLKKISDVKMIRLNIEMMFNECRTLMNGSIVIQ